LLLAEDYPYFLSVLQGPYLSSFIKEFIHDLNGKGWDLAEKHKKLIGTVSQIESKIPPKKRTERQKIRP